MDLVIKGGTVVTASETSQCDVGIAEGKIVALAPEIEGGAEVIDATGLLVLPGGIDSHVHLDQYQGEGVVMADGFESGSRSAVAGGNTCIIPFALQQRGQSLREAVADYHRKADGQSLIDYGFHLIVTDPTPAVLGQELPALIAAGYTSVKIFMTYDDMVLSDRQILEVLSVARDHGALVMVHAEGYDQIKFLTDNLERAGKTAPFFHAASRPELVEREATHRAISHAELIDIPIMIVHVSGAEALAQIEWARAKGLTIHAETCPQYLVLTADHLMGLNMDHSGAKYVCSPPPRDKQSQDAIWQGVEKGAFQTVGSDHCPFRYEDSFGKSSVKARTSFRWVPNGIPGLAARLPILFSEGVVKGRISLQKFVELTSTNHAKLFGLYPQKGTIAVGSDADLVLWDPAKEVTITQSLMQHGSDYTPYEGIEVTGWPVQTIARGKTVFEHGEPCGDKGHGRFLARNASQSPDSIS